MCDIYHIDMAIKVNEVVFEYGGVIGDYNAHMSRVKKARDAAVKYLRELEKRRRSNLKKKPKPVNMEWEPVPEDLSAKKRAQSNKPKSKPKNTVRFFSNDPRRVLGVNKDSSKSEIRKAYLRLALDHHPNKGGNENIFKKIQKAYDTLHKQAP